MNSNDRAPKGAITYFIVAIGLIIIGLASHTAKAAPMGGFYCEDAAGGMQACSQTWTRKALPSLTWESGSGAVCHLVIDGNERASGSAGRYQLRPVDVVNGANAVALTCGGPETVSTVLHVAGRELCRALPGLPPVRQPRGRVRP